MKQPLELTDECVKQVIKDGFDIDIRQLEFIPIGESSWLYKVTDTADKLLALKVVTESNPAVDEARRLLALANYAYAPHSYLSKEGVAQVSVDNLHFSIEDYIEHGNVKAHDTRPDPAFLFMLGQALSSLHSITTDSPKANALPVEVFQSMFLSKAQASIVEFREWAAFKPEAQMISDLLDAQSAIISRLFSDAKTLGINLAKQQPKLVLTHGDVHFGNTLETDNGHLYIIDWDQAMLACPAHDLMYFDDEQLRDISKGYGSDLLANQVELQYYRNHLMLRFIWFWLHKAMDARSEVELQNVADTIETTFNDSEYLLRALAQ